MFRRLTIYPHLAMHMARTPVHGQPFMAPGLTGIGGRVGTGGTRYATFAATRMSVRGREKRPRIPICTFQR
jgi:hypothetical protein